MGGYLRVPLKGYHKGSSKGVHKGSGIPEVRGTLFLGPYNKDPTIWGTRLGSLILGKSQMTLICRGPVPLYNKTLCGKYMNPKPLKPV